MTVADEQRTSDNDKWSTTTFAGHRREQLQQWAKMTFEEKLDWMEEAQKLALEFETARATARPIVPSSARKGKVG